MDQLGKRAGQLVVAHPQTPGFFFFLERNPQTPVGQFDFGKFGDQWPSVIAQSRCGLVMIMGCAV